MLEQMKPEEFDQVYSLMQESFPADEYRPFQEQKILLLNPKYCIYVVHETEACTVSDPHSSASTCTVSDPRPVRAFLAVWQFDDFTFIEHFAVDSALRGHGTGSMILKEADRIFEKQICLEAELPDTDISRRRIGFYKRNGYFLNRFPYMQPPVSEGRKELPLLIMSSKEALTRERFEKVKAVLYRDVYRVAAD